MYSLHTPRLFRAVIFGWTALCIVAPQIACIMPGSIAETEQQCCDQMVNDCGGSGMSHECCNRILRPDLAIFAGANPDTGIDSNIAVDNLTIVAATPANHAPLTVPGIGHSPPDSPATASVILRI